MKIYTSMDVVVIGPGNGMSPSGAKPVCNNDLSIWQRLTQFSEFESYTKNFIQENTLANIIYKMSSAILFNTFASITS